MDATHTVPSTPPRHLDGCCPRCAIHIAKASPHRPPNSTRVFAISPEPCCAPGRCPSRCTRSDVRHLCVGAARSRMLPCRSVIMQPCKVVIMRSCSAVTMQPCSAETMQP
eukprot:230511-Chlamydomonas_euryale.AAC.1